jgi:hypothetical protein
MPNKSIINSISLKILSHLTKSNKENQLIISYLPNMEDWDESQPIATL